MSQKFKPIEEQMREARLKDIKRANRNYRLHQYWTAIKRLSLIGLIGYYGTKTETRQTIKSFLKSASAPIEQKAKEFKEGVKFFNETLTPQDKQQSDAFHERRRKQIKELCKEGMQNPNYGYAEYGTKEARETLEFYRKEGVFKD